jgi:hypothetical protein
MWDTFTSSKRMYIWKQKCSGKARSSRDKSGDYSALAIKLSYIIYYE